MLNFDMIGSRNFVRFVYDGDNTLGDPVTPPPGVGRRSGACSSMTSANVGWRRCRPRSTAVRTRPFIEVGIPAGGLFTGAEGLKTEEEAAIFGGCAG